MDFADRTSSENSRTDSSVLIDTLLRASQTLRLRFNDWLAQFELNDGRYAVLKTLASAPDCGCSQAELAEQLGQSESNVSTRIERMQRDGLVSRLRSEADRRKRVLSISPAGRLALNHVGMHQSNWASQELKEISATDQSTLLALLQQLGRTLQRASEIVSNEVPVLRISSNAESPLVVNHRTDPIDDPKSPQFALQQMLLALSVHAGTDSMEKDVA